MQLLAIIPGLYIGSHMQLLDVGKIYYNRLGQKVGLSNINLSFDRCGMVFVTGPSGSGKTTLFNILSGRDKAFEGEIINDSYTEIISQDIRLIAEFSIYENLHLVSDNEKLINELLTYFELDTFAEYKVSKLSSGQKRRVQIIRSLLCNPDILLCDEPDSFLDYEMVQKMMRLLKAYSRRHLVIVISHNEELAKAFADRLIIIKNGRLIEDKQISDSDTKISKSKKTKAIRSNFYITKLFFKNCKSHNLALFILMMVLMVGISLIFAMFAQVRYESNEKVAFSRLLNVVVDEPKEMVSPYLYNVASHEPYVAFYYDTYRLGQIEEVLKEVDGLIGAEYGFNDDIYKASMRHHFDGSNASLEEYNPTAFKIAEGRYNTIFSPPYLLMNYPQDGIISKDYHDRLLSENNLAVVNLNGDYEPMLLYGDYTDGVVISLDLADEILAYYDLESGDYASLIGRDIALGLDSGLRNIPDDEHHYYVSGISLRISGVCDISSSNKKWLFWEGNPSDSPFLSPFVADFENLIFSYVEFYLRPGSDYEALITELNEKLPGEYSDFVLAAVGGQEKAIFTSPKSVITVTAILIAFIYLGFGAYLLANGQRRRLNKDILKNDGYNNLKIGFYATMIIAALSGLGALLLVWLVLKELNFLYFFSAFIISFSSSYLLESLL